MSVPVAKMCQNGDDQSRTVCVERYSKFSFEIVEGTSGVVLSEDSNASFFPLVVNDETATPIVFPLMGPTNVLVCKLHNLVHIMSSVERQQNPNMFSAVWTTTVQIICQLYFLSRLLAQAGQDSFFVGVIYTQRVDLHNSTFLTCHQTPARLRTPEAFSL